MPVARRWIPPPVHGLLVPITLVGAILSMLTPLAASPARAAEHAVQIADSAFAPGTLTITAGDSVIWTNADDRPHTVTSVDGAFDSGNVDEGASFSFTFTEPGTYTYRCEYHPDMQATIVVEPAAAQASASGGNASGDGSSSGTASAGSEADAGAEGATAATSHAPGAHAGGQPDTALEAPISLMWLAPLLIGLGLVSLAFGVIPPAMASPRVEARSESATGWRR
jgi:plastocyanin